MNEKDMEKILTADGLSKSYGGLHALSDVNFDLIKGEVHAVVGENGAGKSTMMKILAGIIHKDKGTIHFQGEQVEFRSPLEAIHAGIAVIHQELSVMPTLNIVENLFMGRLPDRFGMVRWKELIKRAEELLSRVGLYIDPLTVMNSLSISQRQLIEIARTLSYKTKIIIMDEPNSSLAKVETDNLFSVIRDLKEKGISIVYVSHKIEEVLVISDRITVLRDGKYIGTIEKKEADADKVIQMMVGRELKRERGDRGFTRSGEPLLCVRELCSERFADISFDLYRGEILCFSGLVGCGRSEVMRSLMGAERPAAGTVQYEGEPVRFTSPATAIARGFAMVPEDRKKSSLFMNLSIKLNMSISRLPNLRKKSGFIDNQGVETLVEHYRSVLNLKAADLDFDVSSLSGGNQQKVVLARWLATEPKVLILDEPTHGIDVGAKAEIYNLIRKIASSGIGVILISSELPEVIAMADRIIVMHEGRITGELTRREDFTEERIMAHATGFVGAA